MPPSLYKLADFLGINFKTSGLGKLGRPRQYTNPDCSTLHVSLQVIQRFYMTFVFKSLKLHSCF